MSFEIQNNVPLPPKRARLSKYPFDDMKSEGESFYVEEPNPQKKISGIRAAAKRNEARTGKKYLVRQVRGGIRVWLESMPPGQPQQTSVPSYVDRDEIVVDLGDMADEG